jgi:hypothetical protein
VAVPEWSKAIVNSLPFTVLPHPLTPSPKDNWFPTFVGMVKGEEVTSLERGINIERGRSPLSLEHSLVGVEGKPQDKPRMIQGWRGWE